SCNRGRWTDRLPIPTAAQLDAIETVIVDAVANCRPQGSKSLVLANAAMDSVRAMCERSIEAKDIHLSLVSGIFSDHPNINISLSVDGEEGRKYFVDEVLPAVEKASDWSDVRVCESPLRLARIDALFMGEKVAIDWQNEDGVKLSKLLSLYNKLHKDVLPLRAIVRSWAEKCDLTNEAKLATHHAVPPVMLDVMLIHSLQQSGRLPSLHEVRDASGKDVLDENLDDILPMVLSTPWNLATVFLEFLKCFSVKDARKHFIRITPGRASKTDSKFNDQYLHVMDPFRDHPIVLFKKNFQFYFINCFLTSCVYFKTPRLRGKDGSVSEALVDVDLFFGVSRKDDEKKEIEMPDKEDEESKLLSTFGMLKINVKDCDLSEISSKVDGLSAVDYNYSFDRVALTGGYKCEEQCTQCDSTNHKVDKCPQLAVPPIEEISLDDRPPHWKCELDDVMCSVFETGRITPERRRELWNVLERLHAAIRSHFATMGIRGTIRLDAYGSSESGFGMNTSDLDLCFRFAEEFDTTREEWGCTERQDQTLAAIQIALMRNPRFGFYRVFTLPTAKVPIVEFATWVPSGEIEGDISYYNELALHNTRLLARYCLWTKDDLLAKLGVFIKRWAKQCDIGDATKRSLSSYAYIILLIHFLQRMQPHPLLPVLQE
ncbi:hypothetical protein PENTCL1PPCAC_10195, partial [Pristionchus entomophagus]